MKIHKIAIQLQGTMPIMFDRYAGDNNTVLQPQDKMYFAEDGKTLVLPSANVISFLTAQNTTSAPKRFLDSKEYKKVCLSILSYINIEQYLIPFTANGEPVVFDGFDDKQFRIDKRVARLAKGIPNPKERPVLDTPWELGFTLNVFENSDFQTKLIKDLFTRGGMAIGFGTFRGFFGKFAIDSWDEEIVEA